MKYNTEMVKASTIIGISTIFSQILGFLFLTMVARLYSNDDYGQIYYLINLGTIYVTVVSAGFPTALVRYISKYLQDYEMRNEYFTNIITLNIGLLVLVLVCTVGVNGFHTGIIFIIIGMSISNIYLGMIRGFIDYKKIALFSFFRNFSKLLLLLPAFYILNLRSTSIIILIYAFGSWITILGLEILQKTKINYSSRYFSKSKIKEVTSYSVPIMISMIGFSMMSSLPVIIIKYFYDYEHVSFYSTAMALTEIFSFLPLAIVTISMPKISNSGSKIMKIKYTVQSLKIVFITGIILLYIIYTFGENIITLIFTEKYVNAYPILTALSVGAIFGGLRNIFAALWEGSGAPIISTYDIVVASLVCSILSFVLVPIVGPIGAAYGYSMGLIVALITDLIFWKRYTKSA